MSIFGNILNAIFGQKGATPAGGTSGQATTGGSQSAVDVEAILTEKASQKGEKLNWRQSIVDLMKLLDLDSSLAARKQLAQELGYAGELNGSAEMNIWLHKQVMKKLADNGGKVPETLKS